MPKRPLSNLSNNFQAQQTNNNIPVTRSIKRTLEPENENIGSLKKSKLIITQDADQENEKGSMLKKLLSMNRILENVTHSQFKSSSSLKRKDEKSISNTKRSNTKEDIDQSISACIKEAKNEQRSAEIQLLCKDKDQEFIEIVDQHLRSLVKEPVKIDFSDPINYYEPPAHLPHDVEDYDLKNIGDINAEAQFAYDIFEYYFEKEKKFEILDYIDSQPEITKSMRAILIDWIVELQNTLHLNHETIYLSIKIVDIYLSRAECSKATFQLLGSTALLIASKFDSRLCPQISSFLYVCDNAYTKEEMIQMERDILAKLDFDLSMPLSYRFLRRYARCAGLSMETLTFARYILETCLLEYDFIKELDSKIASCCLLLVFKSKKELNLKWTKTLEFYTHYKETDLLDLMNKINIFMQSPLKPSLKTIREKYLSSTYFRVAACRLLAISNKV